MSYGIYEESMKTGRTSQLVISIGPCPNEKKIVVK
jgi:hypothetical protein